MDTEVTQLGLAADDPLDARVCEREGCGKRLVRNSREKPYLWRRRRFCGAPCARLRTVHPDARLGEGLDNYVRSESGCWVWQGYCDKNGYGRAYDQVRRRMEWVHRLSYATAKGPIPARYEIDHVCCNTRCMKPAHLDAVTRAEHVARTIARTGVHERHLLAARLRMVGASYAEIAEALQLAGKESAYSAVKAAISKGLVSADDVPERKLLNDVEREEIVELVVGLNVPQTVVGRLYSIDSSQVSRIASGKTSGHSVAPLAEDVAS